MATRGVAQTVEFIAWNTSGNAGKTGDGANFTMRWVKDGTSSALTTTTVTEIDSTNCPGLYKVSISSTEADCNIGYLHGKSSTANVSLIPVKIEFERLPDAAAGASGGVLLVGTGTGALNVSGGRGDSNVTYFGGAAGTFSGGRPEVNTTHLAGTAYASADFSTTMKASINTEADTALTDYGPLKPTTAGRTLDVSVGGEAGIDWANVGSPTTTVGLSGTTISTSQAVASVSGAVGSVTGAVGSVTGNVGGNVTGSVGSVVGAVGSVTGNVGGNVTGSVGSVASYGTLVSDVATAVWASGTRTLSSFGSLVSDIWTSFNATQFAKFFSVDSGTTYAGSVAGSVVKEIADNASGGGGGGGASQYALEGTFFRSGSTYYWIGHLRVNGSVVTSGLSSLAVVDVRGNNGATDLGYTAGTAATIGTNGTLYGSFTLTTAPTDGQPCALTVTVVYGGTTYRGRFIAAGVP